MDKHSVVTSRDIPDTERVFISIYSLNDRYSMIEEKPELDVYLNDEWVQVKQAVVVKPKL